AALRAPARSSKGVFGGAMSAGFDDAALSVSKAAGVSASSMVKATTTGVSSVVACAAMAGVDGRSFVGVTVTTKLRVNGWRPSWIVTVRRAEPLALVLGRKLR